MWRRPCYLRKWNFWFWNITINVIASTASPSSSWTAGLWRYVTGAFLCESEDGLRLSKAVLDVLHLPTSLVHTECHLCQAVSWRTSQAISLILFWNPSICSVMYATVKVSLMSESLRWMKTVITLQGPWFVRRVFLRWACDNLVTRWCTTLL